MKRKAPHSLELLETRIAPAAMIFTVTTTADSGAGSLRQAITDANLNPGIDEIHFSISGAGAHTIQVGKTTGIGQISTALPSILEAVVIDGTTEPGYAGTPLIRLSGANAPALSDGLTIAASGVAVKGIAVTQFGGNGINIGGADAVVQASYLGIDPNGNAAGNGASGITITAAGALIGGSGNGEGNVISGNGSDGVRINASNAIVAGNLIGLSPVLDLAIANGGNGVNILGGSSNTVGGANASAQNVISGNTAAGVAISSAGGSNVVQFNFIGTNLTGEHSRANGTGVSLSGFGGNNSVRDNVISGNTGAGVAIASSSNTVAANIIGLDALGTDEVANGAAGVDITGQGNTIGGNTPAARNIISGNTGAGVYLHGGSSATGNAVLGNFIGTGGDGATPRGNAIGVLIDGASGNTIGGTANVISGNATGISLTNSAANNSVAGNFIGTDASGAKPVGGMQTGVAISGSSNNTIGGSAESSGNVIAFASGFGVQVLSGAGNAVLSNAIFLNAGGAIDLGGDGRTANDGGNPPDGDTGANGLQNFPVLISSTLITRGVIQVAGQLDSTPNSTVTVQFFGNPDYDLFAAGAQGHHFLGETTVSTNGNGHATFSLNLPFTTADGPYVTATATSSSGSTSEFSQFITTRVPVTLVNSRLAVYHDVDDEPAYVAINKGEFTQANFVVVPQGLGGQLQLLDLAHSGSQFDGAKLIINAGPVERGRNGTVNVGRIDATGVPLALVTVGGDLAQIDAGNGITAIGSLSVLSLGQLGRSTQTPTIAEPLLSSLNGSLTSITVSGDVLGTVSVLGGVKNLTVLGKLLGGDSADSGRLAISGYLGAAKIGSVVGGSEHRAGSLQAGAAGAIAITRSVIGGAGEASGSILVKGALSGLIVNGDIRALASGAGADSATIQVETSLSKALIRGDLEGGRIVSGGQLGSLSVLGDATGLIAAAGKAAPQTAADALAIKAVYIGGTAAHLSILAGHDYTALGKADNASVQIGAIRIAGNLYASDIAAGAGAGADRLYGTADDSAYAAGNSIVSRIASITVLGTADGTPYSAPGGHTDRFGIVAKQIGAMTISNRPVALTGGKDDVSIGTMGDYRVREL